LAGGGERAPIMRPAGTELYHRGSAWSRETGDKRVCPHRNLLETMTANGETAADRDTVESPKTGERARDREEIRKFGD